MKKWDEGSYEVMMEWIHEVMIEGRVDDRTAAGSNKGNKERQNEKWNQELREE